jgi:hypothetical protein
VCVCVRCCFCSRVEDTQALASTHDNVAAQHAVEQGRRPADDALACDAAVQSKCVQVLQGVCVQANSA